MKRTPIFLILFIGLLIVSSCTVKEIENKAGNKKDRNMFGHGIPRGLTKSSEGLADGYVMFTVPNSPFTYLINRKGEVVHEWKSNYNVGFLGGYLLDDGSLIQCAEDPDFPVFGHGGPFGRIQKISWDGKMLWDFEYATQQEMVHHDVAVLPNGNVLAIVYVLKSYDEAIAKGRKPELTPKDGPWLEKIVEIEQQGKQGGKIVWEWNVWDHLIQNNDASKANYGNPKDHPELLDFNVGEPMPPAISQDSLDILKAKGWAERNDTPGSIGADIYHFNAIKFNSALNQIVISSPELNEIFIIDHSTTTQEAASHKGGRSGKGGDFLYRWGNPENYQRGDSTDRQLGGQHDARWIEEGKPGAGNLTVFNNNIPGSPDSLVYSAVFELSTPVDPKGNYIIEKDKPFGPAKPTWVYIASDSISFHSGFISGAHRMNNGNTFINEGARGRLFEVTPEGKTVWEYLNPYRGEIREPNGDPTDVMPMTYSEFRSTFIPANHPAFAGKVLKPLDPQPKPFVPPPPPKEGKK
jgi:hypothetical protein